MRAHKDVCENTNTYQKPIEPQQSPNKLPSQTYPNGTPQRPLGETLGVVDGTDAIVELRITLELGITVPEMGDMLAEFVLNLDDRVSVLGFMVVVDIIPSAPAPRETDPLTGTGKVEEETIADVEESPRDGL